MKVESNTHPKGGRRCARTDLKVLEKEKVRPLCSEAKSF
jgi:hypothetical protein